jgi:hypothetical protein
MNNKENICLVFKSRLFMELKWINIYFFPSPSNKKEPNLEVSKVSGSLKQGSKSLINVTYTNRGETAAEDSQAKIAVMKPLSTSKSIARLGTIGPGESQTASFEISADPGAVVKNYGIDSEIKYVDNDGKTRFSENMKVYVN